MSKFRVVDLFSGCGGLLDGFLQDGHYDAVASVEWEKAPSETLVERLHSKWGHQNAKDEVIRFDIQRTDELLNGFDDEEYGQHKGLKSLIGNKSVDMIIGGPPCQAYSLAGRIRDPHGMKNDYRNFLFESYIKVLLAVKPKFFIFENVVGLLSANPEGTPIKDLIFEAFKKAGYIVTSDFKNAVFDVSDFGIPQKRKRIIILGVRDDFFINTEKANDFIECFYSNMESYKSLCTKTTVAEAIFDLPKLYPIGDLKKYNGKKYSHEPISTEIANHVPRFHNQRDIEIFKFLADDIKSGRNEYVSIDKLKELYTKVTGKESNIHKYYVLRANEPSNTIPAHLNKDGMRHIHPDPEQARSITVREAARLQSFDDDFVFGGSMMAQYKMVGNAVPPLFAKIIAGILYKQVEYYK